MKNTAALALALTFSLVGCTTQTPTLSIEEAEEIGVCGANADPSTGAICTYDFSSDYSRRWIGSTTYEKDGFDWVRCVWETTCNAPGSASSGTTGEACLSVIGTGCAPQSETAQLVLEKQIPPGTPANGVDAYCASLTPLPNSMFDNACNGHDHSEEQWEDLCCVPRKPAPKPAPQPQPQPVPDSRDR